MKKLDDLYFLKQAFKAAWDLSQDENTQTGAVLVSAIQKSRGLILSEGANRMHYGLEGRFEGRGKRIMLGRPEKYELLTHAERDAIFTALRKGNVSLIPGSVLYATWTPCRFCAEVVINSGIKRFVTHQCTTEWYNERRSSDSRIDWDKSIQEAIKLFQKCKVEYTCVTEPLGDSKILFDDKIREI